MPVKCLDCDRLTRVFELSLAEYFEARAVPFFRVCRKLAAHKKVDMERARYDLEEHRLDCHFVPPGTFRQPTAVAVGVGSISGFEPLLPL